MKKEPEKLLFDANVLIDLLNSDFNILKDVKTYVAEIYVLREILENEVPELTKQACHDVGLVIIKPKEHVAKESETKLALSQLKTSSIYILRLTQDLVW